MTKTALECLECNTVFTEPETTQECPDCGTNNIQTWEYKVNIE